MAATTLLPTIARSVGDQPCYLVGGYLRDLLLGRESKDIDLAAPQAECLAQALARALDCPLVAISERWPLYRVIVGGITVDFTTVRGSLEQDLLLRDFTINALGAPLPDYLARGLAAVVDPTGGRADLERRLLRLVHKEALRDDPVRIARAFRLAATLDLDLDADLLDKVYRQAPLIHTVAAERLRDEFFGVLAAPRAADMLEQMKHYRLLPELIPELVPTFTQPQTRYHHLNVWQHQVETIRQLDRVLADEELLGRLRRPLLHFLDTGGTHGRSRLQLLRGGALLHDLGKPATASGQAPGVIHFYGHAGVGADLARPVALRLRLSRREQHDLVSLVALHLRPLQLLKTGGWRERPGLRFLLQTKTLAPMLLLLSLADHLASRGPATSPAELQGHREMTRYLLDRYFFPPAPPLPAPVNGHLLIRRYGLRPGPRLGNLLEEIKEAHLLRPFANLTQVWEYAESHHPDLVAVESEA